MIPPIDNSPPVAGVDMILVDDYAVRARRSRHPIRQAHRPIRWHLVVECIVVAAVLIAIIVAASDRVRHDAAAELVPVAAAALEAPASPGGIAAYAAPSHGSRYLAIPEGPGVRVRICAQDHPTRCVTRTSTDAGPALSMQRLGRVADLSFVDFGALCACPPATVGTIRVSIEYVGSAGTTPPPTDTQH